MEHDQRVARPLRGALTTGKCDEEFRRCVVVQPLHEEILCIGSFPQGRKHDTGPIRRIHGPEIVPLGAILRSHQGVIVGINREPTILEGEWSTNLTVLLRFASREQALEWYNSEDYKELVQIRYASSTADLIVIDGRR
jgi:uncharacterized protein (DUF1330 family)